MSPKDEPVRLDLNNPVFQAALFSLPKPDQRAALTTLQKLLNLTWSQLYRDAGLKWEKIHTVAPPPGIDALYSLRLSQSRRATAYREGPFLRFLTIAPDHDATYGRR
jgi:hypothetical protein